MRDKGPMKAIVIDLQRLARGGGLNADAADLLFLITKKCVYLPHYFRLFHLRGEKVDSRVRRVLLEDINKLTVPRLADPILFPALVLAGFNIDQDVAMKGNALTGRLNEFVARVDGQPSRRTIDRWWESAKRQLAQKVYRDLKERGLIA